jgi:hypothetical protein
LPERPGDDLRQRFCLADHGAVGFIGDLPQTFTTGDQGRRAQGSEELRPLLDEQWIAKERVGRLFAADAGAGEETTEARSVFALGMNEKFLALDVARVFQGGGNQLILVSVGFETQDFGAQSVVESDTNFVRFAVDLGMGHRGL